MSNGKRYLASQCKPCHAANTRAYRQAHLEERRAAELAYVNAHREESRARSRQWYATSPKAMQARARRLGATVVEDFSRQEIIERDRSICHACGEFVPPELLELDHVIPLKHGGQHTRENVRVAHRECNLRRRINPGPKRKKKSLSDVRALALETGDAQIRTVA